MLEDTTNLPEWVQAKITLAEDYVVSAAQYMQNEMNEELETQGSSVKNIPYDELDMDHLVQDVIKKVAEDDGPHTSKIADTDSPNFQTVVDPVDAVNKQSKLGNVEPKLQTAKRMTGKPFKTLRKALRYGIEDLTGAVANVAFEEVELSELKKSTIDSAVQKRAERLVGVENDKTLSPSSPMRKILTQYHTNKLRRNAVHKLVTDMPSIRQMMYKKKTNEQAEPKKQENAEKKKFKEMRSKERFDARTKTVDNNYPYRSDN
jgi:hypothetical protein